MGLSGLIFLVSDINIVSSVQIITLYLIPGFPHFKTFLLCVFSLSGVEWAEVTDRLILWLVWSLSLSFHLERSLTLSSAACPAGALWEITHKHQG